MTMFRRFTVLLVLLYLPAPAAAQLKPLAASTLRTTDTTANSLVVGGASGATTGTGGIKAGQVSVAGVGIIGTDGRIPAISSTYFASLSGATLTGIVETAITDGAILARVASTETISGSWTFTATTTSLQGTSPILRFYETDAAANSGKWYLSANSGAIALSAVDDAEGASTNVFTVARSGTTVGAMTIGSTQVLGPDGAAATPAMTFSSDPDTGFYRKSANTIGFSTAGVEAGYINGSGIHIGDGGQDLSVTSTIVPAVLTATNGTSVLVLNRTGSDGFIVDLQQDSASEGSISVSGTTIAYNTFMGAHYTQLIDDQDAPPVGTVVVSTGVQIPSIGRGTVDPNAERFVYVKPSTKRNQKGVYGIWFADLNRTAAGMSWGDPDGEVYQVAALGLSTVWVTDTCGPIATGDWLASSPREGLAERQCTVGFKGAAGYDPVNRDYTLGKALVDVDWSTVAPDEHGIRKALIPLTIVAG